ncbi:MAG: hypothetical protein M1816_007789 [Peltula sp. TS41687]|nr:MAG: hypothetical protein M1816_007789 [Peltula sp. TS41687]
MADTNQDLERFRQEWRDEVTARVNKGKGHGAKVEAERIASSSISAPGKAGKGTAAPKSALVATKDDNDRSETNNGHDDGKIGSVDSTAHVGGDDNINTREPRSALEHYERAVEKENQGSLGDSLNHYRKAYKLDSTVEKSYKKKYFTGPSSSAASKPNDPNPSNAPVTVPNPAHHSLQGPTSSISDLINSFSTFSIVPTGTCPEESSPPPPPCPISTIPSEVLIEILLQVALQDLGSFARLAQTCKRLAYFVATEQRIWKRVCCGWEVGFGGMHYRWACDDVFGHTLEPTTTIENYLPVPLTPLYPTYAHNLRYRPRIRFNGCYISTVNYVRPGAASVNQVSWNSPVHIVTYYRYLRFFRDGTVISLLSTTEPVEVVHHLTKENLPSRNPNTSLRSALRGRWKLSGHPLSSASAAPNEEEEEEEEEGNITIETEGVDPVKYLYLMKLSLRPAGGGDTSKHNNRLVWRGFWSYNRLTDDWAEFGLKNDRPFWWSRVRSYGMG